MLGVRARKQMVCTPVNMAIAEKKQSFLIEKCTSAHSISTFRCYISLPQGHSIMMDVETQLAACRTAVTNVIYERVTRRENGRHPAKVVINECLKKDE